jgi:hypothetical protein
MIKQPNRFQYLRGRIWQDFAVFVAEVRMGSFVSEWNPNYALLSEAAQTIQRFLDVSLHHNIDSLNPTAAQETFPSADDFFRLLNPDPWDLEIGFWSILGEESLLPT